MLDLHVQSASILDFRGGVRQDVSIASHDKMLDVNIILSVALQDLGVEG